MKTLHARSPLWYAMTWILILLVLALLVALTGSILPGVVFHVLINISGDLTTMDLQQELSVSAAVLLICLGYGAHLVRQLRRHGPAGAQAVHPAEAQRSGSGVRRNS